MREVIRSQKVGYDFSYVTRIIEYKVISKYLPAWL